VVDLDVDQAGSLYYLTHSGTVEKISFGAPVIAMQPVGQTVNQGESATFTVAASGASLSYQWQHLVGTTWVNVGTSSPAYTIAAATIADAGSYRVIVGNSVGSAVSDAVFLAINPAPPVTVAPGLEAAFFVFNKRLKGLPKLKGRVAAMTRTDAVVDYVPATLPWPGLDARFAHTFAVQETGFLEVSTPGRYKLSLLSRDGSTLWLDGALRVNNRGIHPLRSQTQTVTLTAGLHALRVEFFANTGIAGLVLSWLGPAIPKQIIPASQLFHATSAVPS
jgi:hypothetical protein